MPTPTPLEVWFTGDTPRVAGDSLFLQVDTNVEASVMCILNATTEMPCEDAMILRGQYIDSCFGFTNTAWSDSRL